MAEPMDQDKAYELLVSTDDPTAKRAHRVAIEQHRRTVDECVRIVREMAGAHAPGDARRWLFSSDGADALRKAADALEALKEPKP